MEATPSILITNAAVFDGKSEKITKSMSVLIEGNKISKIAKSIPAPAGAMTIDAKGRTLMPGLIDNHWHSLFATLPMPTMLASDIGYLTLVGAQANREALMRGFTTVRDVGGNVFALKKATDEGIIDGPRIYPSGSFISQTGGHGDFRGANDVPVQPCHHLSYLENAGITMIADGVPEVIRRTREVLRQGTSQVKAMAGGGVSSIYDPVDVTQYTFEEMRAIVEVAETYNTYVCVHAFTPDAIRQSIEAGVKCIEHGHLLDEPTLKLMAEKGVWLSMQPLLDDEDAIQFPEGSENRRKYIEVTSGTDRVYQLAKKHKVKIAWGTDTLFDPELARKQGKVLTKLTRWFTPFEALKMATCDNAQLIKMCGPRDPYPGELGVVAEGALADLILVDGNPLEHISLIADPEKSFSLIVKDGQIYKNTAQ